MANLRKLSGEECIKCLKVYRTNGDVSAFDMLVICNMWRVRKLAKEFLGLGLSIADLISAGNMGLVEAINKCELDSVTSDSFGELIDIYIRNAMTKELHLFGQKKWIKSLSSVIDLNDTEKASLVTSGIMFEDEIEPLDNNQKFHI